MGCVTRARWCVGGGACWLPVWAWVASRFLGVAGGYWRVVGEGLFLPPFFCCCRCSPVDCGEAKGGGVGRVFSFFFLCGECGLLWLLGGM